MTAVHDRRLGSLSDVVCYDYVAVHIYNYQRLV